MTGRSLDAVLADLAGIVRNFDGREYSGSVDAGTRFFGDLGLASIDAVVLAERLQEFYGQPFPFQDFLADLGRRGAQDLTLGELATFIHTHLRESGER